MAVIKPLSHDCFEVLSGLNFIGIISRVRAINDNGAIYINNSLYTGGRVLDTQDRSSNLIRVIHAFLGRRRVEYSAARFFIHLYIAAIGVINALEVRRKRGGTHFVVLEGTIQEDDNSSVSVDLTIKHPILGIEVVNVLKSGSILIFGVADGGRRGDVPGGSVEEEDCQGAI